MKYISFSCISYQLILLKVNKKHHIDSFNHQLLVYKSSYFPPFSSLFPSEGRITALMWNVGLSLLLQSVTPGLSLHHGEQSLASALIPFLSCSAGVGMKTLSPLGAQLTFPAQQLLLCGQNSPSPESKQQSEFSVAFQWCLLTLSAFTLSINVFAWSLCGRGRIPGTACGNFWGLLSLINHRIYMLNYL